MLLNCSVGEDSWESLGLQGDPTSSILKEISPKYSLEGLMLKLKLQYFGYLMQRTDSFEKTLMLGKIEGGRRRGQERMRWLDGITDWMDMIWASSRRWWWAGSLGVLQSMGSQSQTQLSDWTELIMDLCWQSTVSTFQHTVYLCHCFPGYSHCLRWFWSPRRGNRPLLPYFTLLFAMQ